MKASVRGEKTTRILTRKFCFPPIFIPLMTQGMATLQGYTPTKADNLDQKLQLHYFSRIYLSKLLAPGMTKESQPRILSVLSAGVHSQYSHYEDDFELQNNYSIKNAADAAGFYNDAGFEAFSDENPSFVVAHASPGFVNTRWGTEMPGLLQSLVIRPMQSLFGKSSEECGEILTESLLKISQPGYHLIDDKGREIANGVRHTKEERDVIWSKTLELLPDL